MIEKRITETFARGRIAYPQFEAAEMDNTGKKHRRKTLPHEAMNQFYQSLRDAAVTYIEELAHASDGVSRTYTAEYSLRQEGDIITVEYVLRLRRRGRLEAQKNLLHQWRDGYLIPPRKKRTQKRKTRLKPPPKEDII